MRTCTLLFASVLSGTQHFAAFCVHVLCTPLGVSVDRSDGSVQ